MRKRASSAQLGHLAKRQRSNANLCDEVIAGQHSNENSKSSRHILNEGDDRRSSEDLNTTQHERSGVLGLPDTLRIQEQEEIIDSSHEGSLNIQAAHPGELESLEASFQRMKVRDRNHSVSQFTIY